MGSGGEVIDFTPLKRYSTLFKVFRTIRRARMVLLRLALLYCVGYILVFLLNPYSFSASYSSSGSIDLGLILFVFIFVPIAFLMFRIYYMDWLWRIFANKNGFKLIVQAEAALTGIERVPSFRGKFLAFSSGVITGTHSNLVFAFFARQYKEGGVLRWREWQMDTILTLALPAESPHIIINARKNERARRSNLSVSFPDNHRFQFEGIYGDKYDVFTNPSSRIVTLQLFTPDVLSVLYDKLPSADIEIKGDKLWIVQRYGILDDELAESMFVAASEFYGELSKQMKSARLLNTSGSARTTN